MQGLSDLSNDALLRRLHVIVGSHRHVTADLIAHLGEVDARRLYADEGFPSLFSYCVDLLHFSEDEACRRIEAARLARRFPAICPLLVTGALSLTVMGLIKPHLTEDNHGELLAGVSWSSVRKAKEWLASRFPQPDVPWSIRKLPESRASGALPVSTQADSGASPVSTRTNSGALPVSTRANSGASPVSTRANSDPSPVSTRADLDASPVSARADSGEMGVVASVAPEVSPSLSSSLERQSMSPPTRVGRWAQGRSLVAPPAAREQNRIQALSRDRFLMKFTASRVMFEKLEHARDLMRHANPSGDLAVVLERALDSLVAELEKKQGRTRTPHKKQRPAKESYVTRAARREVVGRHGWRCSFVAEGGRRCEARGFLEFDHETPKGCGGNSEAGNLRLLCRAHNRWAAERVYGRAHISRAIANSRERAGECTNGDGGDKALMLGEPLGHR